MAFANLEQAQRARPLRCWSERQIGIVRGGAQARLEEWCRDWSLDAKTARVVLGEGDAPPPFSPDSLQRALQTALFGATGQGGSPGLGGVISREIRTRAWNDLRSRLLSWSGVDLLERVDGSGPPVSSGAWSGDLPLHWSWGGLAGRWWLTGDVVATLLPRSPATTIEARPKVPLGKALAGQTVAVQVGLSSVALRLGDLASLSEGDIVRLPHALHEPLAVSLAAGHMPLCAGWLGQRHGLKALELAPASEASPYAVD